MKSVRLFDFIQFDGASWQVAAHDGAELALKNLSTGRIRRVQVAELLADDSYLPDAPAPLPSLAGVALLETLEPAARAQAELLHRHVYELVNGTPPDAAPGTAPKPEYDLANPLLRRIEAKAAELAAAGTPISARTLRRHVAAYRKQGIAGLADGRNTRQSTLAGWADPELVALLEAEIAGQTNTSTGTRSRAVTRVRALAERQGLTVPSRATLYRILAKLEKSRHPFGNATTRRTQASRPDRTWGRQAPARPGELVEIDSSPLDLMLIYPDGSTGKADLTVALDIATRTPLAAVLRPEATKAVDAAVLLARAMTPLPLQPGWDAALGYSRSVLPQGMIPGGADVRSAIAAKPVIVPESITVDRGKVYIGATFTSACERLQISLTKAAPRTGTDKPHIERFFAGVNSGFTQYLAGYTGPNVVRRGKDPAAEARFSLADVQNLLDWWLVAVWQNRPHPGLRHPAMPKKDLTPNEAFAALSGVAPQIPVTLTREDYIALLPLDWRTIQPYGINFHNLHYDNPALHEYRGVHSGLPAPANGRWEIRYDPYRLQSIHVRDHRRGVWIEAEWTMARQLAGPFSLDVLAAAKKALDKRSGSIPGADLLAEVNRIMTAPAGRAEARAARRASASPSSVPDPAPLRLLTPVSEEEPKPEPGAAAPSAAAATAPAGPRPRRHARRIDLLED
ncbi:Mu transposase C-terminal domain-containing protein [Arthrobacter sp. PAMC25284]|uniref:Mu transposase C-terminal domain-containing protein n=1 Tax=Arthrobacter sp. PAMC25284 TaxID=2861279 RepID=UPI001C62EAF4|nr:Mu transposase C-terminal domain-containing protein [Arthrobacter sp. PAMC25284]QYF90312.1 Mu transposase C-terminal domain-containing protein [Arthrobacter sp. PAMC25284]